MTPTDATCCVTSDKQFTGHQKEKGNVSDPADDLYFMKSRFYDPYIGRFLQPDSKACPERSRRVPDYANPQSLNRYSYVLNNPLRYTDPTGHWGCTLPFGTTCDSDSTSPTGTPTPPGESPGPIATFCPPWAPCFERGPECGFLAFVCGLVDAAYGFYVQPFEDVLVATTGRDFRWRHASLNRRIAADISLLLLFVGPEGRGGSFGGRALLREGEAEFAAIKSGSAGGETAGKVFPKSVRDAALEENPSTCVYCHMESDSLRVDHAIPRSRGGNATIDNAQVTCRWCNASKGAREFPVNPPPNYRGPWPPQWWRR